MAKKKAAKASSKAIKKAKATQKVERKGNKKASKSQADLSDEDDDQDLEGILEKMRREWEAAHTVTEELVEGPPSRRANATLTACPNGNHLWCIGGELFSEDGKAYFYNDVFRYTPEKDEWRKFVSPTCPGPRSAHSVVATPTGGGKIFLFGGEFSSLHQTTFHHYRDFWVFDIATHSWDRIDTHVRPSARSGHRMAMWKHYIVLFGGFYDPGVTTRYLNDLWIFDTQAYSWRQVEFRDTDTRPSPRSGFSFLPSTDGILLHGGYCKEYTKGKRPIGVMLDDTWFLNLSILTPTSTETPQKPKSKQDPLQAKWTRRKRPSYLPTLRSGCTMTLWTAKGMGLLFGGVTDEDTSEERLESFFWNDLYGYHIQGKGRWMSMTLKRPKKKGGGAKKKDKKVLVRDEREESEEDVDANVDDNDAEDEVEFHGVLKKPKQPEPEPEPEPAIDPDDPNLTVPLPRYNAMLAVLRNTLYIYGGIYERGAREYTLDDFYSIQLDKMERYVCLKESGVIISEGDRESSSSSDDDDDDDDEDYEEGDMDADGDMKDATKEVSEKGVSEIWEDHINEQTDTEKQADIRSQATAFMGVSKDATRSPDKVISTPLPGETLAMFYARSRDYWSQKAHNTNAYQSQNQSQGKQLRRDGFALAEERYAEYKPILEEVERILGEAGLDEEEMRQGAHAQVGSAGGQSRNRR